MDNNGQSMGNYQLAVSEMANVTHTHTVKPVIGASMHSNVAVVKAEIGRHLSNA